jgi:hypothetical protein
VEEDRTPDLRIANAALSQLSYHPMEVRILALFRPGDNARLVAVAGAGISCPHIQLTKTRSLHADQSAFRLQGNRTALQKQ